RRHTRFSRDWSSDVCSSDLLLQIAREHEFAVIEMGARSIGEIGYLCTLAQPDVALVNNVMPAHIAGFGSLEGVALAKGEIYLGRSEERRVGTEGAPRLCAED